MSTTIATVFSPEVLGAETVCLIAGPERKAFRVHWKLLCMHCQHFIMFYKSPKRVESFANAQGSVESHALLVDYLYRMQVPSGPQGVRRQSVEGKAYVEQMHNLFLLAKGYDARELMNRVMDNIQGFDQRCGGSMYRWHMKRLYIKTTIGSPLRWYYSIASASYLALATASSKYQKRADKIMAFRKSNHRFKADLGRARNEVKRKIAAGKLDFRDQNSFGVCEFHSHRIKDVCHTTMPLIQTPTPATRAPESRTPAQHNSDRPSATGEGSDEDDSGSEDEADLAEDSHLEGEHGNADVEHEESPSLNILEESISVAASSGQSNSASNTPAVRSPLFTPDSIAEEVVQNRYRERAPSAETKLDDMQLTRLSVQAENDSSKRPVQKIAAYNTPSKPRISRNFEGRNTPTFPDGPVLDQLRQGKRSAVPSSRPLSTSRSLFSKLGTHTIFDSNGEQTVVSSPSIAAARHRFSKKNHDQRKGSAAKEIDKKNKQPPASAIQCKPSSISSLLTVVKAEKVEDDIYTATPPPASADASQTKRNHSHGGKRPTHHVPQGPKRSNFDANRTGTNQRPRNNAHHRVSTQGVQKHRARGRKGYRQQGRRGKFISTASIPSDRTAEMN